MEVLDINEFLSYKTNPNVVDLDSKTLDLISSLFGFDKFKKNKKATKINHNVLKSMKVQNKKDNTSNRVNLILNKLSESNIDNLIIEFIENINQVDEETWDEIQKTFYLKIISEINFVKIYLQFLKVIGFLYFKVMNYNLSYFYNMIEMKFKSDYSNMKFNNFLNEIDGETKRINNLILIKSFVDNKFMSADVIQECDNIMLNQTNYLPDIYYWFKGRDVSSIKSQISAILSKNILPRERVLLESLIKVETKPEQPAWQKKPVEKAPINTDSLKLECENIVEEYTLMKNTKDLVEFIETRCVDAISKNKFCYMIIDKYFLGTKEESSDLLDLIKTLIKSQVLFKSNLSRGLIMIYNNWNEKSIDYNKANDKMKTLLITLKSIGITKNLENLLTQYNIE